jgi:hypothetical protein
MKNIKLFLSMIVIVVFIPSFDNISSTNSTKIKVDQIIYVNSLNDESLIGRFFVKQYGFTLDKKDQEYTDKSGYKINKGYYSNSSDSIVVITGQKYEDNKLKTVSQIWFKIYLVGTYKYLKNSINESEYNIRMLKPNSWLYNKKGTTSWFTITENPDFYMVQFY